MASESIATMAGGEHQESFGVGPLRPHDIFLSHSHSQSWRERQKMLKGSVRPLITLVLALMATGALSALSHASTQRMPESVQVLRTVGNAPAPRSTSGEPDQPLSPPPVRLTGTIQVPMTQESPDQGGVWEYWSVIRWTSQVWVYWFSRAAL